MLTDLSKIEKLKQKIQVLMRKKIQNKDHITPKTGFNFASREKKKWIDKILDRNTKVLEKYVITKMIA